MGYADESRTLHKDMRYQSTLKAPTSDPETVLALRHLMFAGLVLALLFSPVLFSLVKLSLRDNLHSHVLLVPFISLYLAWLKRAQLSGTAERATGPAMMLAGIGATLVGVYGIMFFSGSRPIGRNEISLLTAAFVTFLWSASAWTLGEKRFRTLLFPLGFLVFLIPLPTGAETRIEQFLQHGSAEVSYLLLKVAGTPVFRDGTEFKLPTITLEVAPECSGIRSSLVLLITALLAGHFFLQKVWTQVALATAMILLGILRNAVRIFVIAELCVHVDPDFIDSAIHRRGGPVFFAASLIPFLILLWLLRRSERNSTTVSRAAPSTADPSGLARPTLK